MEDFLLCAVLLTCFILHSWSLYTISKRRGLPHAWVSWVPLISIFQLGTVADHDRLACKGKKGLLRWWLILCGAIYCAGVFVALAAVVQVLIYALPGVITVGLVLLSEEYVAKMGEVAAWAGGVVSTGAVLCVPYLVVSAVARYRVYRSCNPSAAVPFLLLSIVLPFLQPVLLFLLRDKDDARCGDVQDVMIPTESIMKREEL